LAAHAAAPHLTRHRSADLSRPMAAGARGHASDRPSDREETPRAGATAGGPPAPALIPIVLSPIVLSIVPLESRKCP
jgi:hypothetical protein